MLVKNFVLVTHPDQPEFVTNTKFLQKYFKIYATFKILNFMYILM
jgi:hypothetical protein